MNSTVCPGVACTTQMEMPDMLCDVCWSYRATLLGHLPWLWNVARDSLQPGQTNGPLVSGGAGPASKAPLRMSVLDAMEAALLVAETWASVVLVKLDVDQLPARSQVRTQWLWEAAVSVLVNHDSELSGSWLMATYYNALYKVRRRLALVTGAVKDGVVRLTDACPSCGRMSVVVRNRGDHIVCLTCSGTWGQAAYQAIDRSVTLPYKSSVKGGA